jgi:hypothetical protein
MPKYLVTIENKQTLTRWQESLEAPSKDIAIYRTLSGFDRDWKYVSALEGVDVDENGFVIPSSPTFGIAGVL